MKKILVFILMLCLFIPFAACSKNDSTGTDTPDTSSKKPTPTVKIAFNVVKGQSTVYRIVYNEKLASQSAYLNLQDAFMNVYSTRVFPEPDSRNDAIETEILIGNTNRAESAELLKSLSKDEYGIKLINQKIVINAHTDQGIKTGVAEFISKYMNSDNKELGIPEGLNIKNKISSEFAFFGGGWTFTKYSASNDVNIPYQIHMPKKLDSAKKYPVLLFMHGLGSVGSDGKHISKPDLTLITNLTTDYAEEIIIIAPQHPSGQNWIFHPSFYGSGIFPMDKMTPSKYFDAAMELLDAACTGLPIDTGRIYGYGNSMGATAIMYQAMKKPDLFAALIPVVGGCDPNEAASLKNVPIWLFHGDKDTTTNHLGSQGLYDNLIALGAKNAKLTIYPGAGHNCADRVGNTPQLIPWLLTQKR